MTDQPGIYVGELPPSFAFGHCVLSVAYAALDSADDEDKLPELRVPSQTTLTLTPNLTGAFLADGKVMLPSSKTFTSTDGTFDFWAIDASHSTVAPSDWAWVAQLTVDDRVISRFEFQPDSTRADAYNLGPLAVLATAPKQPTQAELQTILNEILANASEGPKGDDGRTPVLTWNGTVLVVDGVEGPDLKGPEGDQGDPGPANILSIGTVTKGITADAEITGDAPAQVLNLVLPQGDKGDEGDPGTPGLNGSATPLTGTGFPAAGLGAVGDTYIDTAATAGALVWRKWPTGWRVQEGDTGWRRITSEMTIGAGTIVGCYIRRVNGVVTFTVDRLGLATPNTVIYTLPTGFALQKNATDTTCVPVTEPTSTGGVIGVIQFFNGDLIQWKAAKATEASLFWSMPCRDPWPSTLPGTPA